MYKEILSGLAIALTLYAFIPYIRSILRGKVKPHLFSWLIWGTTTFVIFLAALSDGGGAGAWPIGVSGLITLYITYLAYRHSAESLITRTDWSFFIAALSALPVWFFTADPLWAVVILTTVDLLGFGPTFRKAYALPFEENIGFFMLFTVRNFLVMVAMEHYSLTTLLFPALVSLACLLLILMIVLRRRVLAKVD